MRMIDRPQDPLALFEAWYGDAVGTDMAQPDAMALATTTADGHPSQRIVLYKGLSDGGLRFVTNYQSRKAAELEANPRAALLFWWPAMARQIRIEGEVKRLSAAESDAYFEGRPRGSQLGAWASPQSEVLGHPEELQQRVMAATARFPGHVPRPPHWGGYRLVPLAIEFWQQGEDRLHTRLRYRRNGDAWVSAFLAP